MRFELWDMETGNLVGDYDSEAEALSVVREAVRQHGRAVVAALALGAEFDEDGGVDDDLPPVIHGSELADRALRNSTGQAPGSPS